MAVALCAVLTGQPPYVGETAESTRQLAARTKLDDAHARLAVCGAEPELVALCKRCLSPEPADRPRHAGEVAEAVGRLRADAEDRARRAELDRARAEVQAAEQRKRREIDPTLRILQECVGELEKAGTDAKYSRERLEEMLGFLTATTGLFEELIQLPTAALKGITRIRGKLRTVIGTVKK